MSKRTGLRSGKGYLSPPTSPAPLPPASRRSRATSRATSRASTPARTPLGSPAGSPGGRSALGGSQRSTRSTRSGTSQFTTSQRSDDEVSSTTTDATDQSVISVIPSVPSAAASVGSRSSQKGGKSGRKNKGRTSARGIDIPHQKVIAEDVEAAGGPKAVLAKFTDFANKEEAKSEEKAELCGAKKSSQRYRVNNKIRHWAELSEIECRDVLTSFGVLPSSFRQPKPDQVQSSFSPPSVVNIPQLAVPQQSRSKSTGVKSRAASYLSSPKPQQPPTLKFESPPVLKSKGRAIDFTTYRDTTKEDSSEEEIEKPRSIDMTIEVIDGVVHETITVDPDSPELTRYPFKAQYCRDMPGKSKGKGKGQPKLFDGFQLTMRVDPRDMEGAPKVVENGKTIRKRIPPFPFTCEKLSNTSLKIKAPLLEFSDRGNDDEAIRGTGALDEMPMDALDNMRGILKERYNIDDKAGLTLQTAHKFHIVHFREGVRLSADALDEHEGMPENELAPDPIPLRYNISALKDELDTMEIQVNGQKKTAVLWLVGCAPRLSWRVADLNQMNRNTGPTNEESSDDEELTAVQKALRKKANLMKTNDEFQSDSYVPPPPSSSSSSSDDEFNKKLDSTTSDLMDWVATGVQLLDEVGNSNSGNKAKKRTRTEANTEGEKEYTPRLEVAATINVLPLDVKFELLKFQEGQERNEKLNEYLNSLLKRLPREEQDLVFAEKDGVERVKLLLSKVGLSHVQDDEDLEKKMMGNT